MEQSVEHILQKVMEAVQGVPGVVGVVLGGSRARGTHKPDSDVDIGIYYDERAGFSVEHLSEAAARLDDDGRKNLITPLGGWGPWVNAGGWLVVKGYHVDLILRDLNRVAEEIQACSEGRVTINSNWTSSWIPQCHVHGRSSDLPDSSRSYGPHCCA